MPEYKHAIPCIHGDYDCEDCRPTWTCAYDGTTAKLIDGRCAACGRASAKESKRDADKWDAETREHTPTPWRKECSLFREENISIGIFSADDPKNQVAKWHCLTRTDAEKVHANVDFIVWAVNAHEEMLAALRLALKIMYENPAENVNVITGCSTTVKQAIAKAEGRPSND